MINLAVCINSGQEFVPRRAITMGLSTIMAARRIVLMAFGEGKAKVIRQTVEGPVSPATPATTLQRHPNCLFVLDTAAAADLSPSRRPWLTTVIDWDETSIKAAVIDLARLVDKPDHLKKKGDLSRVSDHIFPKRVVVFSPHPDDDVISMGGTLIRLADQGHEVHIAYQTSGNFEAEFNRLYGIDSELTA